MTDTRQSYSGFTVALHWVTAALVVSQISIPIVTEDLARPERMFWMNAHKSLGLVLMVVTLARLAVRLGRPLMPLPGAMAGWERFLARATQIAFYILLIGLPLGGWIASTAAGRPIQFFGFFPWPNLPFVPLDGGLAKTVKGLHEIGGKALIGLIILHVLGALKHYLVDKDNVLQRMVPFLSRRPG